MKLKRSKIVWVTLCLFIFIPLMMSMLMYVAQHPELAEKMGLMGAKAQFFSENSWRGYLEIINQLIAVLGVIGFGFVTAWVFGREYLEHTMTDILALPVSRTMIVSAKYIVVFVWCATLSMVLLAVALLMGIWMDVPGWESHLIFMYVGTYLLSALYTILLCPLVGVVVHLSRGIVAPLGFVLLMVVLAQFVAIAGWGPYFPWAIPGVFTVQQNMDGMHLVPLSYCILGFSSLCGFVGTYLYWHRADHE